MRALVADEAQTVRRVLCAMLQSLGHEVVAEARDLQEAVAALVRCEPDVVFVDLDLLGEDPSEPLGRLRGARATTAIIVCATMERIGDVRRAGAAGASGALERPFRHARLAEALERVR